MERTVVSFVETIMEELEEMTQSYVESTEGLPPQPEFYDPYLQKLEEQRELCEQAMEYRAAGVVQESVDVLRNRQREAMIFAQQQRREMEKERDLAECEMEVGAVSQHWQTEMDEFRRRADQFADELRLKQSAEMDELEAKYAPEALERQLKFSKYVLDTKARMEAFAKQRKYDQAAEMKEKFDALCAYEREQYMRKMMGKREREIEILHEKHENEWSSYQERASSTLRRLSTLASSEMQRAQQRFVNHQNTWEGGEKREQARVRSLVEKQEKRQGAAADRLSNTSSSMGGTRSTTGSIRRSLLSSAVSGGTFRSSASSQRRGRRPQPQATADFSASLPSGSALWERKALRTSQSSGRRYATTAPSSASGSPATKSNSVYSGRGVNILRSR